MNLTPYMNKQHTYGTFDCIMLVTKFYKEEFGIHISLPEYPKSDEWMTALSIKLIDSYIKKYSIKIDLQNAKNYDLLVFSNNDKIIHFGIFIAPFRMLHIIKGQRAKIEVISNFWRNRLYNVYRVVQ